MSSSITFLGTSAVLPAAGRDSSHYLLNGSSTAPVLIDCGWSCAQQLLAVRCHPADVRALFLTHCHQDHYLGLVGLLLYRAIAARRPHEFQRAVAPLEIIGPPDDMPRVVELARQYLQADRFPEAWPEVKLTPLEPGETWKGHGFRVETIRALHPVTGSCSRWTDLSTGTVIAFSGDTAPHPQLADLARSAQLLVHEATCSPDVSDPSARGHSRAMDAARIALEAGVQELRLVHISGRHEATSLSAARSVFGNTHLAVEGETLVLGGQPSVPRPP